MEEIIQKIRKLDFVHSIVLFGSRAKGAEKEKSDFDLCIITKPYRDINLKERISLENSLPENFDISLFQELPINIRKRVFQEGQVLFTEDIFHVLTLAKKTDLEYAKYRKFKEEYHASVVKKMGDSDG